MAFALSLGSMQLPSARTSFRRFRASAGGEFPSFIPKQMENVKDAFARKLVSRIERLPVDLSGTRLMASCVKPVLSGKTSPVVLLHGFDSSCLEWRYAYPLLEEAGLEAWAVDVLGWGFSDLEENLPSCDVESKRECLYQMWKSYIKKPMILVGPSLGAALAIDFTVAHPEAVEKLVLIDASVYAEGTGKMSTLPKVLAYAGVVAVHKERLIGSLHCQFPWWEDATVDFMRSGGFNVSNQIEQVNQRTLIIWGQDDRIIDSKLAVRLHCELPNAILRQIPDCGHLPHVEKPVDVVKLIAEFIMEESPPQARCTLANGHTTIPVICKTVTFILVEFINHSSSLTVSLKGRDQVKPRVKNIK
ncbi:hypothetical protein SAY87_018025 [Trapa incisa]|uniref:AB hydrolase-1 domain-containing protein n=1 Tax=Trapa incisa TaxID=236973 RepID=A0AAN7KWU1_9MYRT|nr:hypothetical protein SAY87_018025 [Trapa incisa]